MPCRFPPGAWPPRPLPWCILAASLAACGGGEPRSATLAQGDSVQIEAAYLGPGWHPGTVGQIGECTALLVPSPPPPAQATRFDAVPFDSVTAIRRGGKALPAEVLRRTYGGCSPF